MSIDPLMHLKYPIGKFEFPKNINKDLVDKWIGQIESLPIQVREIAERATEEQLNTTYRPNGWTVRQVIHHLPDSHVNCYIRFKWALTEPNPTIKAYNEAAWSELTDTIDQPIDISLDFLEVIHCKLTRLFKTLDDSMLQKTFVHPETGNTVRLDHNIGIYAWHGLHHLAHIKSVVMNH